MNDIHQHIIARLKQQARHGQQLTESEEEKNAKTQIESQLRNAAKTTDRLKSVYAQLTTSIDTLAKSEAARATGIQKSISIQQELAKSTLDTIKSANVLAQRNAELQKSFGLSVKAAAKLGYELDETAASMGISRAQAEKNYVAISKLTGGMVQNSKSLQKLNKFYTTNRGVSQDAADGLLMFASSQAQVDKNGKLTEQSLENQAGLLRNQFAAIEEVTGIKGAQLEIENAIGSAASSTRLTFGKYPGQLGVAVMKAKALGLELADLETVGANLLNIESSVGEELNYQLLTGHRLVDNQGKSLTNKYREAYLTGKAGDAADALNNNLLARQQMAKTLGIEENQLAKIVEKRKLMKNLINETTKQPISIDLFTDLKGKELEQALKDAGAANKDIAEIMKQDDTRSPDQQAADSLASIEANGIKLQMGSSDEAQRIITATAAATKQMVTDFGKTMGPNSDFQKFITGFRTTIGSLSIEAEKYKTEEGSIVNNLFKLEKAVGGMEAAVGTYLEKALNIASSAIPDAVKNAFLGTGAANITDMTVTNLTLPATPTGNDTVMINDGIRFNPRDKFRTINDGMTVAGTNVGGLDRYAAQLEKRDRNFEQSMSRLMTTMAANITQAIQRANLKVNIDRSFGGTSMNPRGKFGGK